MSAITPRTTGGIRTLSDQGLNRALALASSREQREEIRVEQLRRRQLLKPREPWYVKEARLSQQRNDRAEQLEIAGGVIA